jgi:enoyl-CoA hydratase/carnithine racemase
VPQEELLARAIEMGEQIAVATPRRASAATKLALVRADDTSFEACITYEAYLQNYMFTTDEHRSRLRSLMQAGPGAKGA